MTESGLSWFGDQQVHVLGHEDVSEDVELVAGAEFFEGVLEGGAGVVVMEEWETTIAAEGDEVISA